LTAVDDRNLFDLTGRLALITGGAGLIGTRIGRVLAANGARVILADLDGDVATRAAETVAAESDGTAVGLVCDVADPVSVREAVAGVVRQCGGIDILFNNAAGYAGDLEAFFTSFEDYSLRTWRKVMSVNLDGAMLVAQAVGSHMVETGRAGSIVQTASIWRSGA
jgi:NAD(P)-dependent dehydrogenase (short-subunit alcohol dehydrogenase family)